MRDLILLFLALSAGVIGTIVVISFWLKRERRLIRNLKRPIMVFGSPENDMQFETDLLRKSKFFDIEGPHDDLRNLQVVQDHCLLIISYSKDGDRLKSVVKKAEENNIPLVIYAKHGEINRDGEDMKMIGSYHLAEIANSPLRLMNLIFSILSIYEHDKR